MNKRKTANRITALSRRAVQLISFLIFPGLFIQIFYCIKSLMMLIFHQQGTLQSAASDILLLAVTTLVTAVAGRFFCGWMCAFGSMQDLLYRLPRMFRRKSKPLQPKADFVFKWIKYILLFVIVVFVWGLELITIPSGINPWELFGMLASFGSWPSFSTLLQGWIPAMILLTLIMVFSIAVERFFCRYFCPLGAYLSLIGRFRPMNIAKQRDKCGSCSLCTRKCSMGLALKNMDRVETGECINCMECTGNCPSGNAHLDLSEKNKNILLAGTVSASLIGGAYFLGNFLDTQYAGTASASAATVNAENQNKGEAADLKDGTYTGSGTGFRGETDVEVNVADGLITGVSITSSSDDAEYLSKASKTIIAEILAGQSSKVDTVSGATYSSKGIISAVENALTGASGTAQTESTAASGETAAADTGAGTASADTAAGTTADTAADTTTDTAADTASGSTSFQDGTYTGSGTGFRGETDVTVTVSGGKITNIKVDSYQDDQQFFERASATVIQEIISNQSVKVDAVSGATYSSSGIKAAVADALNLSYTADTVQSTKGHGQSHGFR